jgi:hypothetical protein
MKPWHEVHPGDFADNAALLTLADYETKYGRRERCCEILAMLQKHIEQTGEVQSIHWLLPAIRARYAATEEGR